MPLDQPSLSLLQQLADAGAKPFHQMQPAQARAFLASLRPAYGEGPAMQRVEEFTLGSGRECFRVRVLVPAGQVTGLIVHCHGGGWVTMSIEDFDTFGRLLASKTGCAVVLPDYRLAPEHPHPAAVEDCWLALQWASEQRTRLTGRHDAPLIVSGDSAGGNLAAVVAQRSVRLDGPKIDQQVLVYPVTQAELDGPGYLDPANQTLLSRADMAWFWDHYLPDVAQRRQPEASPLAATDLHGLPPAVIVTAEHDVLRDEACAYAHRLRDAGVEVTERCFEGQMHVFLTMINVLPASAQGIDYLAEQIRLANARSDETPVAV
jgi:acetyl esterase